MGGGVGWGLGKRVGVEVGEGRGGWGVGRRCGVGIGEEGWGGSRGP